MLMWKRSRSKGAVRLATRPMKTAAPQEMKAMVRSWRVGWSSARWAKEIRTLGGPTTETKVIRAAEKVSAFTCEI